MDFTPIAHLWTWQTIFALILSAIIYCTIIGAYAARLAGALSGRVATSMSFYNVFNIASRTAWLLYTPLLGALSDSAARHTSTLGTFQWQLRAIVLAGTAGAMIGTVFLPSSARLFMRAIAAFERRQSLPHVIVGALRPRTLLSAFGEIRLPKTAAATTHLRLHGLPKSLLWVNVVVSSVSSIGVVSAAYASVIDPGAARTALLSSGVVNGVALICYTLVVDPGAAFIVDQAARGERTVGDVRRLVLYLALTTVFGMLLSQLILLPAATVVSTAAHLLTGR